MKKKMVAESLNELYGKGWVSDHTDYPRSTEPDGDDDLLPGSALAARKDSDLEKYEPFGKPEKEMRDDFEKEVDKVPKGNKIPLGNEKPLGYKTYAMLKELSNHPAGMRYTDMTRFLADYSYGEGEYDKYNEKPSSNQYRGHWGVNRARGEVKTRWGYTSAGFFARYIKKLDNKKWGLTQLGQTHLDKLEKKFGNL